MPSSKVDEEFRLQCAILTKNIEDLESIMRDMYQKNKIHVKLIFVSKVSGASTVSKEDSEETVTPPKKQAKTDDPTTATNVTDLINLLTPETPIPELEPTSSSSDLDESVGRKLTEEEKKFILHSLTLKICEVYLKDLSGATGLVYFALLNYFLNEVKTEKPETIVSMQDSK